MTALFLWTLQNTGDGDGVASNDEALSPADTHEGITAPRRRENGYTMPFDVAHRFAQPLGIHLDEQESRNITDIDKGVARLTTIFERRERLLRDDESDLLPVKLERVVKLYWPTAPRRVSGISPGTTPHSWRNVSPPPATHSTCQIHSPPDNAPDTTPHYTPAPPSNYASAVAPAPSHAPAPPPIPHWCHSSDPPADAPLQFRPATPPPGCNRPPFPP